jgi:hypothetical protein
VTEGKIFNHRRSKMTVQTNQGQGNANPNQSTGGGKMKWYHVVIAVAVLAGAFYLGRSVSNTPTAAQTTAPVVQPTAAQQPAVAPAVEQPAPAQQLAAPAPNAPAVEQPAVQPAAPVTSTAGCPTTGEVKTLTRVDVQRLATEPCAFVWRGTPPATVVATCPTGWVCTWDVVNDIVVVHLGVNQKAEIRAGTWRFIAGYPPNDAVHDVCALYQKEKNFGLTEVPSFQVRFQPVTDGTHGPVGPQTCSDN